MRGARNNLVPFYSTPALARGRLIVGGTDGSIYALDPRDGSQRWRYDGNGYVYGSAAIWHGRVFIGDFGGGFHAISLKSGRRLWKRNIGPIIGSATVMRGLVYISSLRPPRTYAFDARTGRQVWSFGDGQFSPLIADGKQVWLTGKAHVYRLAERARARPRAGEGRKRKGEGQRLRRRAKAKAKTSSRARPRPAPASRARCRGWRWATSPARGCGWARSSCWPRWSSRARSARWPPAWCWSTWRACWSTRARAGASSPRRTSGAPRSAGPWRSTWGWASRRRRRSRRWPGRSPRPSPTGATRTRSASLSLGVVLYAAGITPLALLQKNMQFRSFAGANIDGRHGVQRGRDRRRAGGRRRVGAGGAPAHLDGAPVR